MQLNNNNQNMLTQDIRTKIVRTASFIALGGNLLLCVLKLTVGLISGSLSVLGDCIDTATDVGIAVMAVLAFIIMFAGIQLFIASINKLIQVHQGAILPMPQRIAIIVTAISIAGKLLLALNQYLLGKQAQSLMILANARNMVNDIVISVSVLIGFIISILFNAPYFDPLVALLVSCWIIKSAITLFIELNVELMDGNTNKQLYEQLFSAVAAIPGVKNPHRARIRKMANLWDIDLDIEVDGSMPVSEAHIIAEKTSLVIKNTLGNVYDIVIHIEPYNSDREGECYGLSTEDVGGIE